MAKAEQPEKSDHPTFQRGELTIQEIGAHILCYGAVGLMVSVVGVAVATHGEYTDSVPVVEVPRENTEAGPRMPNFDFMIPRREMPGVTYLLSTDPNMDRKGKVTEGVQYVGYGAPQDDIFLLDTGVKITRQGDHIDILPLYGPNKPIDVSVDTLARTPINVAFDEHVLTIGARPTDVHEIVDYVAPRNELPPPGMFKQQG